MGLNLALPRGDPRPREYLAMSGLPPCPDCNSTYTYEDRNLLVCPECAHEWSPTEAPADSDEALVVDANGNPLQDGDTVTVIKDPVSYTHLTLPTITE